MEIESKALYMELEMAVSTVFYQDLIEEGWEKVKFVPETEFYYRSGCSIILFTSQ